MPTWGTCSPSILSYRAAAAIPFSSNHSVLLDAPESSFVNSLLLIIVFVPLDLYLQNNGLPISQGATVFVLAVTLWTIGVILDVGVADD